MRKLEVKCDSIRDFSEDAIVLDGSDDLRAVLRGKRPSGRSRPTLGNMDFNAKPWTLWIGAAFVTLAIHSLFIGSLILGTGHRRPEVKPMTEGLSFSALGSDDGQLVSAMLMMHSSQTATTDLQDDDESVYAVLAQKQAQTQVDASLAGISQDLSDLSDNHPTDDHADNAATPDGNGADAVMLFGRYLGQIKARIERAWTYPDAPTHVSFRCRVQILQGRHGEVREVTLQRCDNDPRWQLSLVRAIQTASPLSAPPNEAVFSEVVTLEFAGQVPRLSASNVPATVDIHQPEP